MYDENVEDIPTYLCRCVKRVKGVSWGFKTREHAHEDDDEGGV